jgi:hypothetical protein
LNITIAGRELPVGLGVITIILFSAAVINLFTKQTATISGLAFTLLLYGLFVASEHAIRRRRAEHGEHTDQFALMREPEVGPEQLSARPGSVLVPVRDYNTMSHLDWAVRETDTEARDIVVLTVRLLRGPDAGVADIEHEELFTDYEQKLFTRVVAIAERQGKSAKLLVVPSTNVFDAIAQTAVRLRASAIVVGESAKMDAAMQAHYLGEAWERTPHDRALATELIVLSGGGHVGRFSLGAHPPRLLPEDVARIHQLWLDAVKRAGPDVHHRDIVAAALTTFEEELARDPDRALRRLPQWPGSGAPH